MAGIPAKCTFEIDLRDNVFWWANKARKLHMGTFGDYHNDHVWVLFYDGSSWQPYDSELDILRIKDFVIKRWDFISPFHFGILPFGPPFIVWEDSGNGFIDMRPITKQLWLNKPDSTYTKTSKEEWFRFISEFDTMTLELLDENFIPAEKGGMIKIMCKKLK